jgi:hypothetical protein
MSVHRCEHAHAEKHTRDIPGSAPGRWVQCTKNDDGARESGDAPGTFVRWVVTGAHKTISAHRHRLPEGVADRIKHVTTRFGHLPQGSGVLSWSIEDGHLIVRPAVDVDLGIELHLDEADHG